MRPTPQDRVSNRFRLAEGHIQSVAMVDDVPRVEASFQMDVRRTGAHASVSPQASPTATNVRDKRWP